MGFYKEPYTVSKYDTDAKVYYSQIVGINMNLSPGFKQSTTYGELSFFNLTYPREEFENLTKSQVCFFIESIAQKYGPF